MSKIDLKKDLPFLNSDNIIFKGTMSPYKAPFVLAIFFSAIIILSLDMCFLGIGLISAVFKELRWLAVVLFILKILVDVITFAVIFAIVKEKTDNAKHTSIFITDTFVIIASKKQEEITFCNYEKANCTISVKKSLLNKFCGVFALIVTAEESKKTYYMLTEKYFDKLNLILK